MVRELSNLVLDLCINGVRWSRRSMGGNDMPLNMNIGVDTNVQQCI